MIDFIILAAFQAELEVTLANMLGENNIGFNQQTGITAGLTFQGLSKLIDEGKGNGYQLMTPSLNTHYVDYPDGSENLPLKVLFSRADLVHQLDLWKQYSNSTGIRIKGNLDLQQFRNLQHLWAFGGALTSVQLPVSLKTLLLSNNHPGINNSGSMGQMHSPGNTTAPGMITLDISHLRDLKEAWLVKCGIQNLTLPESDNLEILAVSFNGLTSLNYLSKGLRELYLSGGINDGTHGIGQMAATFNGQTGIPTLNLSGCNQLTVLYAQNCGLQEITLPQADKIETLIFSKNQIQSIFREGGGNQFPAMLKTIDFGYASGVNTHNAYQTGANPISSLDFTGCSVLEKAILTLGSLTNLVLPQTDTLKELYLHGNKLSSINRYPSSLEQLYIGSGAGSAASNTSYSQNGQSSGLGVVDISACNNMQVFDCRDSGVTNVLFPTSKSQFTRLILGTEGEGSIEARNSNDFSGNDLNLSGFTGLTGHFSVQGCKLTSENFTPPATVNGITHLSIGHNNFTNGIDGQSITNLPTFPAVTHLYARFAKLPSIDLTKFPAKLIVRLNDNELTTHPIYGSANEVHLLNNKLNGTAVLTNNYDFRMGDGYFGTVANYQGTTGAGNIIDATAQARNMLALYVNSCRVTAIHLPTTTGITIRYFAVHQNPNLASLTFPNWIMFPKDGSFTARFSALNIIFPLGAVIACSTIWLDNMGMNETNINATIDNFIDNQINFEGPAIVKQLQIGGNNAAVTNFGRSTRTSELLQVVESNNWIVSINAPADKSYYRINSFTNAVADQIIVTLNTTPNWGIGNSLTITNTLNMNGTWTVLSRGTDAAATNNANGTYYKLTKSGIGTGNISETGVISR